YVCHQTYDIFKPANQLQLQLPTRGQTYTYAALCRQLSCKIEEPLAESGQISGIDDGPSKGGEVLGAAVSDGANLGIQKLAADFNSFINRVNCPLPAKSACSFK